MLLGGVLSLSAWANPSSWGLLQGFGVAAPGAWKLMKHSCSSTQAVVAVIDTGIDPAHPALKGSLWANAKEAAGRPGVDDDGNGFVDDVHGWDFAKNSGQLSDPHGHGTHISGIIAGQDASFQGVCPGSRIMSLRYYDPNASGSENLRNTVRSIHYAIDNGAQIINYSGGGLEFSADEFAAMKKAQDRGVLVVAAAGNERSNADLRPYYPASYPLDNIMSVTAIDDRGQVLPSSNWGLKKVHIAAPGNSIFSALPGNGYGFMTGTSQATAFVSGIAALLLTENPAATMVQLKTLIETSGKKHPQLLGKTKLAARADASSAMGLLTGRKVSEASRSLALNSEQSEKRTKGLRKKPKKCRSAAACR